MDYTTRQAIYSRRVDWMTQKKFEAGMHVLVMKSSGPIGYRMKIFMKTVDDMAGPIAIHPEMRRPLQERLSVNVCAWRRG